MVELVATVPFHRVLTLRDPGLQRNGNGFGADMVHVVVPEGVVVFFPQNRFRFHRMVRESHREHCSEDHPTAALRPCPHNKGRRVFGDPGA